MFNLKNDLNEIRAPSFKNIVINVSLHGTLKCRHRADDLTARPFPFTRHALKTWHGTPKFRHRADDFRHGTPNFYRVNRAVLN